MEDCHVSKPLLYTTTSLRSQPGLATSTINLANEAFARSKWDSAKWSNDNRRFSTTEQLYEMLGEQGILALIFDSTLQSKSVIDQNMTTTYGRVVACAAAVPWVGGWDKEGADVERGWEIKAVCVDGDARYLRRGLAIQLVAALEQHLVEKVSTSAARLDELTEKPSQESSLTLWILTADCIGGSYWRRRGFQEIRRKTRNGGEWGCKTSFDMVVLRREMNLAMSTTELNKG